MSESDGKDQALAQFNTIKKELAALKTGTKKQQMDVLDELATRPLSIEVRSDWRNVDKDEEFVAHEYKILLCTGGPAVRVIGYLNSYQEPTHASLEYQDWGTPWTEYPLTVQEKSLLLEYASKFQF